MQSGREQYEHDELDNLVKNWNRFSCDFRYEIHPDEITLDRYVHGATLSSEVPSLTSEEDISAWLNGERGWDTSAISLHVMSCSSCQIQVDRLRDVVARDHVAKSESWWQQVQENPRRIWSIGTLRRSAIALVVVALLFGGSLVIESIKPAESEGVATITHEKGGMSTPDNSNSPVARLY